MKDAEKVLRAKPKKAHVTMIEDELQNDSHNVVATIEGTKYPNEVICFTAHYDSVSYSKGAWDNATGSITILEMLRNSDMEFDEIVSNTGKSKSTVSVHLKSLREAGIVSFKTHPDDNRKKIFYFIF